MLWKQGNKTEQSLYPPKVYILIGDTKEQVKREQRDFTVVGGRRMLSKQPFWGRGGGPGVKHLTLDFIPCQDLRVARWGSSLGVETA